MSIALPRGNTRHAAYNFSQSKTLQQAVKEYRVRYGRNPPKGFDVWFEWAQKNNVQIVDEVSLHYTGRARSDATVRPNRRRYPVLPRMVS